MFTYILGFCLLISVLVLIYMAQKNYTNIDIYYWTIIILIPVVIGAYWLKTMVTVPEASAVLTCFTYLDSTFIITIGLFSMMRTLDLPIKPWMKILAYGIAGIHLSIVCLCVHNDLYYSSVKIIYTSLGHADKVTAGPLMVFHYAYLILLFLWLCVIVVAGLKRKGAYARENLLIYLAVLIVAVCFYVLELMMDLDFSLLPILYAGASVLIALRYESTHTHDISFLIAMHDDDHDARGHVAIGLKNQLLSCDRKGYEFLPFLKGVSVNDRLSEQDENGRVICDLIRAFESDGTSSKKYRRDDKIYILDISYFSIREKGVPQGYLLDIHDATEEQKTYEIIASYNETLNEEVKEKTESIKEIQRKIVLGMANMIENRDNNTGGHVKRTSDIIHLLVDEITRQGKIPISKEMAADIVRAAPTHDLGKITIDSSILNKPARLTPEEFDIMKTHSTKSGEMVHILLDGVEEERFVQVAYNVARYHHERWDGKGYPEGLVGTMIPLEARIMAVADVYDALVSKRCYKEPMSFEQSAKIMCECMGTQFDPNMKSVFLGCREKLEQYYSQNDR